MLTIDADAHVLENPHTWDFLEESEEGFRPEVVVSERQYTKAEMRDKWDRMPKRGAEYWFVDGRLQPKNHNVGLDTTPETREMRDVEARLRHMDELEVDVQVLYPTLFLRPVTMKPAVEVALCRSYNRWLAGLCEDTRGRLRWIALLPFLTMDKALAELSWARDAGACGFMMRGLEGDKQLTDPYFFPLYEEAARARPAGLRPLRHRQLRLPGHVSGDGRVPPLQAGGGGGTSTRSSWRASRRSFRASSSASSRSAPSGCLT